MRYWGDAEEAERADRIVRAWRDFEREGSTASHMRRVLQERPPPPLPRWQLILSWIVISCFWIGLGCLVALWLLEGLT